VLTVFLVSLCLPAVGRSASDHQAAQQRTFLYRGGKRVSELRREAPMLFVATFGGEINVYVSVRPDGTVYVSDDFTHEGDGYARMHPGGFWYVNAFSRAFPRVKTIGTVQRRKSGLWTAYRGLGSAASPIGYSTGPLARLGAIAVCFDPL
jgi:hypothetical protein